jgi:hypothetical protein
MKKYFWTLAVMAVFAVGFAASDEEDGSSVDSSSTPAQTEKLENTDKKEEQTPKKSKKDEIRELGFNNGVKWAYQDQGNTLREYIQSGLSMSMAEGRIKQIGRLSYKEDYGSDISDDLLEEYGEKFCEGYKSIVIKK